jgi:hypothetical protein
VTLLPGIASLAETAGPLLGIQTAATHSSTPARSDRFMAVRRSSRGQMTVQAGVGDAFAVLMRLASSWRSCGLLRMHDLDHLYCAQ